MDVHTQLLAAARSYKISARAAELLKAQPPLLLASISGGGKNTIAQYLIQHHKFRDTVTHTTRPQREDEVNGRDYWFVSEPEMLALVQNGQLIEAQVIHGEAVYGCSIEAYRAAAEGGYTPVMDIDIQGIDEITRQVPTAKAIFLLPPSFEQWQHRLSARGTMGGGEKARRLASAKRELEHVLRHRHYRLVVNREIPVAASEILGSRGAPQEQNRALAQELLDRLRMS